MPDKVPKSYREQDGCWNCKRSLHPWTDESRIACALIGWLTSRIRAGGICDEHERKKRRLAKHGKRLSAEEVQNQTSSY